MIPTVSSQLLWLVLVYALLAFLLLCLLLATRWHWGVKLGAVLLVSGFYALSHATLQGIAGWPSDAPCPRASCCSRPCSTNPARAEATPARSTSGSIP